MASSASTAWRRCCSVIACAVAFSACCSNWSRSACKARVSSANRATSDSLAWMVSLSAVTVRSSAAACFCISASCCCRSPICPRSWSACEPFAWASCVALVSFVCNASRSARVCFTRSCNCESCDDRLARSAWLLASCAVSWATDCCSVLAWPFSSDSMLLTSASCCVTLSSALLRPVSAADSTNCASTNTSSTKMMTISSVESAST